MTRQLRVQRRSFTGQIQKPGQKPENIRLFVDQIQEEEDFVEVAATQYSVEGKTYILCDDDTTGSVITVVLPPTLDSANRVIHVKKLGSSANVNVTGDGTETIDGSTTRALTTQYEAIALLCDGDEWHLL